MEILSALQAAIAARIGDDRFALWFRQGTEVRLADDQLTIATADSFRLEMIRRQFRKDIAAVAGELLAPDATVQFVVDAALADATAEQAAAAAHELQAAQASHTATDPTPPSTAQRRSTGTLASFVVGEGNRLAHSAARNVLARLGMYSPLLFHGPTGSGKSHLLQGIRQQARQSGRSLRIVYLTAEQFTSQYIEALKGAGLPSFRRKIRDTEILLIEDVQFFAGKQSTLVELLHTIDTLLREGRQLVFSADRAPADLRGLGPELIARLGGGLTCELEHADYPTRLGILQQLASQREVPMPAEVLTWLAGQLEGDARQLAGALLRLEATSLALDEPVSLEFAQSAMYDLQRSNRRAVRLPEIVGAVCEFFGLEPELLHSASKSPGVTHPRMLAMFLARKYTRAAFSEIGSYFGRKSHSTVFSAESKVQAWLADGKRLAHPYGDCSVEDVLRRVEAQLKLG
jgi:chromosomal replication initiator protein